MLISLLGHVAVFVEAEAKLVPPYFDRREGFVTDYDTNVQRGDECLSNIEGWRRLRAVVDDLSHQESSPKYDQPIRVD